MFQSPKSGKFESNKGLKGKNREAAKKLFQSPKSGKFESNNVTDVYLINQVF